MITKEQIKCYAQAYLFLFTEASSMQIADFINNRLLKLDDDEKIDKNDLTDILIGSSIFLHNKSKNKILIFRLEDEVYVNQEGI